MKTIGLLGGMAWPSTLDYYAKLNYGVEQVYSSSHSCRCIIYSYDFDSLNPSYRSVQEIVDHLATGLETLTRISVDVVLVCSNTMHLYLDKIDKSMTGKVLDIRDSVGTELQRSMSRECLLLGTKQTMSGKFYQNHLSGKYGIQVNVPDQNHQQIVNQIIFEELVNNKITGSAISFFSDLIDQYRSQTIVLACTELNLLFNKITASQKIIDSLNAHVENALIIINK